MTHMHHTGVKKLWRQGHDSNEQHTQPLLLTFAPARLYWKNMQNFNPNRGEPALQACDQGADLGGFYGPFVDAEDFYEGFELNARQKAVAEAMKEHFRRLNHSLDNHLETGLMRLCVTVCEYVRVWLWV